MNAYQRRWIRICSVGFAVAAVALIHLDSSEIRALVYPSWYERLVASFITAPMAGLAGGQGKRIKLPPHYLRPLDFVN